MSSFTVASNIKGHQSLPVGAIHHLNLFMGYESHRGPCCQARLLCWSQSKV